MVFLWAMLYSFAYILAENLASLLSAVWIAPFAMVLYTAALILWIFRTGRAEAIGLRTSKALLPGEYLMLLPLAALPLCNLLTVRSFSPDISAVVLALCAAVAEELFFRGFLLRCLSRRHPTAGVLLSAAAFGLFHLVNLSGGADGAYTLLQAACAFAMGVFYGAAAIRFGSLLPCLAAHILTNLTSSGESTLSGAGMAGLGICIAVSLFCGFYLLRNKR